MSDLIIVCLLTYILYNEPIWVDKPTGFLFFLFIGIFFITAYIKYLFKGVLRIVKKNKRISGFIGRIVCHNSGLRF